MNLPSYNTEQDNSNKISTKRIPKWILPAIAVLIIIGIAVGAFMLYQNSNSNNNGEESEYTQDYENDPEFNIGIGGAPEIGDTVMNLPTPGYGNVEVNNSGASNSGNTSSAPCALGATGT